MNIEKMTVGKNGTGAFGKKSGAKPGFRYQVLHCPGRKMSDEALNALIDGLRATAASCFETVPEYQAMSGSREELTDKIISIAWRRDGTIAGFCSTVVLPVQGVGTVLHLGLTCVRPEERSNGLTHVLTQKAVTGYLLRNRPLMGKVWISNCAAVLSSLVNVSLHFERVYPSPMPNAVLTDTHRKIAGAIDAYYRDKIYIHVHAVFDWDHFVFRGSVKGTVFQKNETDSRYHHRDAELNEFYRSKMDFENGDEVLQVGYASAAAAVKHLIRNIPLPVKKEPGRSIA